MTRPRDIPDDADEKWRYTEHAAAKHEILHRYLGAWLTILGRRRRGGQWDRLILVDGFAGRGEYVTGEDGSPKIMFKRAAQVAEDGLAKSVVIRCAEPNPTNFKYLAQVCTGLTHDNVEIRPSKETFDELATELADWAERQSSPPPVFVFVDPYGVRGVRLDLLKRLLRIDRVEILLTFMVRDPSRFLEEPNYEEPLNLLFGGDGWRECSSAADRPECLMLKFREVVRGEVAKYALHFRVFEDDRLVPLYYLVHLTNNDLGMREMKKAMVKKSGDMTFWPVTVRPLGQLELETGEAKPYPTLQQHLCKRYTGRTLTFKDLLNEDYPGDHAWIETHYRSAVKAMDAGEGPDVSISREKPLTRTGKPATSLELDDTVTFA